MSLLCCFCIHVVEATDAQRGTAGGNGRGVDLITYQEKFGAPGKRSETFLFYLNLSGDDGLRSSFDQRAFRWKCRASTPDKSKSFASFMVSLLISKQSKLLLIYLLNTEALLAGAATETAFWPSAFVC